MLRGYIDVVTSSGYIEGWAVDSQHQLAPLEIAVDMKGQRVAEGLAHLYREDLAVPGLSAGWCAFRLRSTVSPTSLRKNALTLRDTKGELIVEMDQIGYRTDSVAELTDLDMVIGSDPTLLPTLEMLGGCNDIFDTFVKARGIDAFVRAAYVYILGRPVDPDGRRNYGKLLRQGAIAPYALLAVLSDSDEYRARKPQLTSPTMPGFPFKV